VRGIVFVARSQLRRHTARLVVLALVVGLTAGIAAALVAGSRRSASVVRRYFAAGHHYTIAVGAPLSRADLLAIPGVTDAEPTAYVAMVRDGTTDGINGAAVRPASIDPTIRVVRGRAILPSDGARPVVDVNEAFVDEFGLDVGETVDVRMFSAADEQRAIAGDYHATGPRYRFRIVGVLRTPLDVALDQPRTADRPARDTNQFYVPYPWYAAHDKEFLSFPTSYDVALRDPARDKARFVRTVRAESGDEAPQFGPPSFSERHASFDTPVDVETGVLLALGLATALAGVVVATLLLRAEERSRARDQPVLGSLGFTSRDRAASAALRTAPTAVATACVTVVVAYALSDRFPVGIGRMLELAPGRRWNLAVVAGAAAVTVALLVAMAYLLGRRAPSPRPRRARGGAADRLARAGAPPDVVVGAHLAFQRDGATGVPARQAIAGGAVALLLVTALAVVVGGIDRLYTQPAAHGWPWDAVIGNVNFTMPRAQLQRLERDDRFRATTVARYGQATIGGRQAEALAIDAAGTAPPAIIAGRVPETATEIALGHELLDQLHAHIGGRVNLSVKGGEFDVGNPTHDRELTVVGVAVAPIMGESEFGQVGVVTFDAIESAGGDTTPMLVLARFRSHDHDAAIRALQRDTTEEILADNVPARIVNLHRVCTLLLAGAALAAVLGTVLLAYTLTAGARTRNHELAVLRALGMTAGRAGRVLATQGALLALAMLLIGVPLGLALGAFSWRAVARQLGVVDRPTFVAAIALLVPGALVVGVVAAVGPARRARRADVARALHVE
jgi:hypothetical protein